MKTNIKISINFKTIYSKAKQNVSIVLMVVLVILVLMEVWTVKDSLGVLSDANNIVLTAPAKLVRINFTVYDAIVKRVENATSYAPQPFISKSPFGINEKPANVPKP